MSSKNALITIIDYDAGNILNTYRAIKYIGFDVNIATSPAEISSETAILVIPGVGAFGEGMRNLKERGFDGFINSWVQENKPLVGICLGMQLLYSESSEMGLHKGLGYLQGKMEKIPNQIINEKKYPVPHTGWAELAGNADMQGLCYFVHSYYAVQTKNSQVLASAHYGDVEIPAIVQNKNTLGFQFHPEKSAEFGLKLLKSSLDNLLKTDSK